MTRNQRLLAVLDTVIVLLYALFLWVPRLSSLIDGSAAAGAGSTGTASLAWLALPVGMAGHGFTLASATLTVTITALVLAALGALLSVAARLRAAPMLWAAGAWLFGCSVAILMPTWTAVGFLGALLLAVTLRSRYVRLAPATLLSAILSELWPIGYAAGFAALAWRYNPHILLKCLLIAFGASLVARALLPPSPRSAIA